MEVTDTDSSPTGARRSIAVVPHTHWDREWYEPFQVFRLKLVSTIDALLDQMEQDASYTHFLLDGQLAVVDDYLEIRPENAERLGALTASGRITVGPWYILMDEFLVSGETIIRNLQAGIRRGSDFGGVMDVGYLPDMFGHVAQMPQILASAGFEHAVVWRGVPSAVDRTAFRWQAPDGSAVRAEYLVAGYGNGAALPDDAKALVRRLASLVEEFDPFLRSGDPLLLMNGTDHQRPQPWLGRVVFEANQIQDDFELTISSLPAYLESAPTTDLPTWQGELRSGARANLLMGVGSNRVDVKQAAARAERSLEQLAEPLSALFLPPEQWPAPFLHMAWLLMIRNSAHDSICACSVDDVVDAVLHRYAEARHIGEGLTDAALAALASSMADAGPLVVNPSPTARGGLVEMVVTADGPPGPDIQVLSERAGLPGSITLDGETVRNMLGSHPGLAHRQRDLHHRRLLGRGRYRPRHHHRGRHRAPPGRGRRRDQERALHPTHRPTRHGCPAQPRPAPGPPDPGPSGSGPGLRMGAVRPDAPPSIRARADGTTDGGVVLTNGLITVAIDPDRRNIRGRRHPGLRKAGGRR